MSVDVLTTDTCVSEYGVTEENEPVQEQDEFDMPRTSSELALTESLYPHHGALMDAHVDVKATIVEVSVDAYASSEHGVDEEIEPVPNQDDCTRLVASTESNVLGSVTHRDAGENTPIFASSLDEPTVKNLRNDHSNEENTFSSEENPRKLFGINLTEDEDFESINAMFSKAESMLESQLASILGCPDDTENVVREPNLDSRAAADTICSFDSGDSDVPPSSVLSGKGQVFDDDQSHDRSRTDAEFHAPPNAHEIDASDSANDVTVPSQDSKAMNQGAERSTASGLFDEQSNDGIERTFFPNGEQALPLSRGALEPSVISMETQEGSSISRASMPSAFMQREQHDLLISRLTEPSDDDPSTLEAIESSHPMEDPIHHGLRLPTIAPSTQREPTVLHGLSALELSTPLRLALPLDDRSVAEPLTPTDERPLFFDEQEAVEPWKLMAQATQDGLSTIEVSGSFTPLVDDSPLLSTMMHDAAAHDTASTCHSTPVSLQESPLDSSVCFNKKSNEEAEEEGNDFDDDFARMDSLFEAAENQLEAELASILGPPPDFLSQGSRGVEDEGVDEDLLSSIVEEAAMPASDCFDEKTERSTTGTTSSRTNKVPSTESDMAPASAASFSRGTLRRRGTRRVAPGN